MERWAQGKHSKEPCQQSASEPTNSGTEKNKKKAQKVLIPQASLIGNNDGEDDQHYNPKKQPAKTPCKCPARDSC